MSIPRKDGRSWLSKSALWEVDIPPPKEINYLHYDVEKPNEQHQFDLLYLSHTVFEGNTYRNILTRFDVASRYKVTRALETKKASKVSCVLGAIHRKGDVFNIV